MWLLLSPNANALLRDSEASPVVTVWTIGRSGGIAESRARNDKNGTESRAVLLVIVALSLAGLGVLLCLIAHL